MANGDSTDQAIAGAPPQVLQPSATPPAGAVGSGGGGGGGGGGGQQYDPMQDPNQMHHTIMQRIGHALTGMLPGVAAQRRAQYQVEAGHRDAVQRMIVHGAITAAQKGDPEVLNDPSVGKAFKSAYGPELGPMAQKYVYHTGTVIQQHYAPWNEWVQQHGNDPVKAFMDPSRDPHMIIPKDAQTQINQIMAAPAKAQGTAEGRGAGQAEVEAPWQQHLVQSGGDLKRAYESAPRGMYIPPSATAAYNHLQTVGPSELERGKAQTVTKPAVERALRPERTATAGAETTARERAKLPFKLDEETRQEDRKTRDRIAATAEKLRGSSQDWVPASVLNTFVILDQKNKQRVRTAGMTKGTWRAMRNDPNYLFVEPTFAQKHFGDWALSDDPKSSRGQRATENQPESNNYSDFMGKYGLQP